MKKKSLIFAPAMLIVFVSVLALTPLLFLHAKTAAVKTTSGELSQTPLLPPGDEDGDKTLSPYFYVNGGEGETEPLPLKKTSADVVIAGVIADVTMSKPTSTRAKYLWKQSTFFLHPRVLRYMSLA
jgi:hypothetical protein